jgi:uncharacterized protein DUF4245
MRDMVGAVVVLLLIIGAVLTVFGSCSFSPGGPTVDPNTAPTADASGTFERAARSVTFPVRGPEVPKDWRANSAATSSVGAGADANVVVRVGWVTPGGTYLQLNQSGGTRADVLAKETGREDSPPSGEVDVAGVTWTTYPARREEQAWVTDLAGTLVMITGSGSPTEFRTLATATQNATPLPTT